MGLSFITKLNNMTNNYDLKQPKSMPEWKLIEKLAKNPMLLSENDRTIYHPLTHAYGHGQDEEGENQDLFKLIQIFLSK